MTCDCKECVCAIAVWNGPADLLLCASFPGHEGELSQVAGGGVVMDCRKFCRKHEQAAVESPSGHDVRYISLGHGRAAMVDAADFEWLNNRKWHTAGGAGYATGQDGGKHVLMHRLIMNPPEGLVVDHINGNKWDNRRRNLRVCTQAQNARNKQKVGGTSPFKGVSWNARYAKWAAGIRSRGKTVHLGFFDSEVEAAKAYDRMAIELFGEFACLNFPQKIRIRSLAGRICVHSHVRGHIQILKSEIRKPKSETNSNRQDPKFRMRPNSVRAFRSLDHLGLGHCFGFRQSCFVLRSASWTRVLRLAAGIVLLAGVWLGQKGCTKGGEGGYDTGCGLDGEVGTGLMISRAGRLSMSDVSFFFAGGGTGGHIYPALAVAEEIVEQHPDAVIHFLCSTRTIDQRILDKTRFTYTTLPATGLHFRPVRLARFCTTFLQSYVQAKRILAESVNPVVIGAGGFVAAPVCLAGRRMGVPVVLVNVDIVPGRANRLCARWAGVVFAQFEDSQESFKSGRARVYVVGCPLRRAFASPHRAAAIKQLELEAGKKVLLVTGASSGSASINEAVTGLLPKLEAFAETWQIVHLTGLDNYERVAKAYGCVRMAHRVINYYDHMPDLYAAADLLIGRSGAVSVAEYAVAGVPSICMPYPHHKDRHQYLNAGKLVEVGAAVIVDDVADVDDRTEWLWEELEPLMKDDEARRQMADACKQAARPNAAAEIARRLLAMARTN